MSYEIADARVADLRAKVWTLTHVTFTGAAILRRDKAAYEETWIEMGLVSQKGGTRHQTLHKGEMQWTKK